MAAMFTRLSRLSKGEDYEDLDDQVEMDITDMYQSLGKSPPAVTDATQREKGGTKVAQRPISTGSSMTEGLNI